MSSDRRLLLSSVKEAQRVQEYLAPLGASIALESVPTDCWIEWSNKTVLAFEFSLGYSGTQVAEICLREIAKRFKCRMVGSPDGWWKGSVPNGLHDWVAWAKQYDFRNERDYQFSPPHIIEEVEKIDAELVRIFLDLDAKAAKKAAGTPGESDDPEVW